MSAEVWEQVYDRLAELIEEHRTTLIFVNTRRMAERVARQLSERLGEKPVAAHHGSMSKEQRLDAEQRLKRGELKALVATASLELGIDIGEVDLVCQLGSPRSIASFLQRVGRSGHAVGGTPKGRLFPLSRDELVECAALLDCVRRGELDRLVDPRAAARRAGAADRGRGRRAGMAARTSCSRCCGALGRIASWRARTSPPWSACWPKASARRRGRRGALIHHDAVNRLLRGRRGARLTALTSGGTIPDNADYQVLLEPENQIIGTVNEDFAVESMTGDMFQLGNATLPHPARGARRRARGGRAGRAAQHSVLAGRGARPQRRAVGGGLALPRRSRQRGCSGDRGGRAPLRWLRDEIGIGEPAARADRGISRRGHARSAACRRRTPSCWSASSTRPAACSW